MTRLLVIGATGLVGSRFVELAMGRFDIIPVDENNLDITNEEAIENFFNKNQFDVCLNFAAYTDVAKAETEWNNEDGLCYRLNTSAPKYLAENCQKHKKFLVHFSTDFVFEGLETLKGPFDEDAKLPSSPNNLSWYGWTKNRGEYMVNSILGDKCAVVRIANPFRNNFPAKLDFARKILDLYDKNSLFPLFTDQIITPVFVDDLIEPLTAIIDQKLIGKFHLVSSDYCSYYDFGNYLLEKSRGVKDFPEKSLLAEFLKDPKYNKRPIWGGLNTLNTQKTLNMQFNTWREMVDKFVSSL